MPEIGERYLGTVVKTTNFGAFVSLMPGKDGLLHISKLRPLAGGKRVEAVEDVVSVGQKIQVEIGEIDDRGKLSLVPVVEDAEAPGRGRVRVSRGLSPEAGQHPHPAVRAGRRRASDLARPPYRPAQRAAGRHRAAGRRPVGQHRRVGRRRLARRDGDAARLLALPGAPALQGHRGAVRARHLDRPRRGRRRVQRLHRQGVHVLPRAGARQRPAPGDRRARRHDHQLAAHRRGRRGRAGRHPRRDRDARRRPGRRRAQPVRRAGVGERYAAGPLDRRHGRLDRVAQPGPGAPLLRPPLPAREHRHRGGRQPGPRRGRPPRPALLRALRLPGG